MFRTFLTLSVLVVVCLSDVTAVYQRKEPDSSFGCVLLDSVIWPKVHPNYNTNMVVMVSNKGYIGKQETDAVRDEFMDMAEASETQEGVLYTQILVNGAENAKMVSDKFGISNPNKDLKRPKFFLFPTGSSDYIPLQNKELPEPTASDIAYLITKHTGARFSLQGTHADLDVLGEKFISEHATKEDRVNIIAEAQAFVDKQEDKELKGQYEWYVKIMTKISEKGDEFAKSELARLLAILDSDKVSEGRKGDFRVRVNILQSAFVLPEIIPVKEEEVKTVGDDGSQLQ